MGRTRQNNGTIESARCLSMATLHKFGYLQYEKSQIINWLIDEKVVSSIRVSTYFCDDYPIYLTLRYTITESNEKIEQNICTTKRQCHFGGYKYFFYCPNHKCGKRVTKLYQHNNLFYCRSCCGYSYEQQLQSKKYRVTDFFKYEEKAENLFETIKKFNYRHVATRKCQRYLNLEEKASIASSNFLRSIH